MDEYQTRLGQEQDNFIIDGRLSWHFIPRSFKIFLDVNLKEAARRIFEASKKGLRPDEKPYGSVDEALSRLVARTESDSRRYKKYYKVDYLDRNNYDLIVDTTHKTPEEIIALILVKLSYVVTR